MVSQSGKPHLRAEADVRRRCLYCLDKKPMDDFNTEHVVPQAFGRFGGQSPTLDCVCRSCNHVLGKDLDESLSYYSVEGVHRFVARLKPPAKFRPGCASDIAGILIKEGPLAGCVADFQPSPDGTFLHLVPRPQVGFAKNSDGPFRWYSPGSLLCSRDLREVFGQSPPFVQWLGDVDDRQIQDELAAKGLGTSGEILSRPIPDGTAQADVLATITQKHQRAIAKIAFNYLAFAQPGLAYLPEFNDVRRFVLMGAPSGNPVRSVVPRPSDSPGRLKWHAVSLCCRGTSIASLVLPLGILEYRLVLNAMPLAVPAEIHLLHTFDLKTRKATRQTGKNMVGW